VARVHDASDQTSAAAPDKRSGDALIASELVSRLREIELQPLDGRADAYGQIYDELRRRLELGDEPAPDARSQD